MSRKATAKKEEKIDTSLFGDTATIEKPEPIADVQTSSPESKGELVTDPPRAAAALPAIPEIDPIIRMMQMVERMAVNQNVGPDNLKVVIDAQERILDRMNREAFDRAFVAMQPKLPIITRDGRIVVREKTASGKRDGEETQNTKYAKWEDIQEEIKPILHEYGFALNHYIGTVINGSESRMRCTAVLRGYGYRDDSCYFDLGPDSTGSKNNAQAWASSVKYAERHTGCAVLNIITRDVPDDDAKASGGPVMIGTPMTEERLASIRDLLEATGAPLPGLIKHMNEARPKNHPLAKTLEDIPENRAEDVIVALRHYEAEQRKKAAAGPTK